MVRDAGLPCKAQIAFYLPPLAFRAYSFVGMALRVFAVVYIAAANKGIVLSVRGDDFS